MLGEVGGAREVAEGSELRVGHPTQPEERRRGHRRGQGEGERAGDALGGLGWGRLPGSKKRI